MKKKKKENHNSEAENKVVDASVETPVEKSTSEVENSQVEEPTQTYDEFSSIEEDVEFNKELDLQQEEINQRKLAPKAKYKLTLKWSKSAVVPNTKFEVYIDDKMVGNLKKGSYLVVEVESGQHEVSIDKANPTNITIAENTVAEVGIFAGIISINKQEVNIDYTKKYKQKTNALLVISIIIPLISAILYWRSNNLLAVWFYGVPFGYAVINLFDLRKLRSYNKRLHKSLVLSTFIVIFISIAAVVATILFSE